MDTYRSHRLANGKVRKKLVKGLPFVKQVDSDIADTSAWKDYFLKQVTQSDFN